VGLFDYNTRVAASVADVALGATVIEKHFILKRTDGGVDSSFFMEPTEITQHVIDSARAWQSLGNVSDAPTEAEMKSLQYRRSLYLVRDMKAGETFTPENVRSIRPGLGLPPKYIEILMGKTLREDAARGTPLQWDLLK